MTRKRKILLAVALASLPLLAAATVYSLHNWAWLMRPIPSKHMWIAWCDVDGTARLETEKFTVSFEGASFGPRLHSGLWTIDGKYFNWTPFPREETLADALQPGQDGEATGYLMEDRLFAATYRGHEIRYYDYRPQLTVDGREFPLTDGPVHVVISPTGEMRVVPFEPSPFLATMRASSPRLPQ
jgi:hypothetical protein